MKRLICLSLLLAGCASPEPSPSKADERLVAGWASVKAEVTNIERTSAPVLRADVSPERRIVRVMVAVCTDIAGNPTSSIVKASSGNAGFDRAVQAWVAKASFTPARNLSNQPVEACDSELDFIWQRPSDDPAANGPTAMPANPLFLPKYPAAARRRHDVGPSEAKICIDEQGRVTDIQESSSPTPVLGEAFDDWVLATPFEPVIRDGVPVAACGLGFGIYWTLSS